MYQLKCNECGDEVLDATIENEGRDPDSMCRFYESCAGIYKEQ